MYIDDWSDVCHAAITYVHIIFIEYFMKLMIAWEVFLKARSLVVGDLRSETKGSRFESGCWLCAEVSSL